MTSDEITINHGEEYHLTEDEEHMLFKSEQFFGKKKEHDMQIISKQQMFNYWEEMYEELNGNPNTLKNLKTCFLKNTPPFQNSGPSVYVRVVAHY